MPSPRVWAVNDGEKIDRDRRGHPLSSANSVWNGRRIKLFGARNEIVAFQVIVEAGESDIGALTASLQALKHHTSETRITYARPSVESADYVDRPIQIFCVRYMKVAEPTVAHWIFGETDSMPIDQRIGWKPVQLVPENASLDGFPLRISAGNIQSIWFEIYLGRDLPAGEYHGRVIVSVDGAQSEIPVDLELFDFSLPDKNSLPAMVYLEKEQIESYHGRDLEDAYHRFAHRHRIELVQEYGVDGTQSAMSRFRGGDFTRASRYEGPGEGVGNVIVPFSFYAPGTDFDERTSAWRASDAWLRFLGESLPDAITFLYVCDEPRPDQFPRIRLIAENVKSNPGPGAGLPLLVSRFYDRELEGAVDIWICGAPYFNIGDAEAERARGRDHWVCNGGRPGGGAIVIDAPATDARMMPWACFKHHINVYFYWHAMHWKHNAQNPGRRDQNVWADPVTFDNRGEPGKPRIGQGVANGDGVLMYPGEDILHAGENRGISGPVSTIQLANLRRGLQDHLYLTLARQHGLDAEVSNALQSIVPRVFSEANGSVGFAEEGDAYERARYGLAVAIASVVSQATQSLP